VGKLNKPKGKLGGKGRKKAEEKAGKERATFHFLVKNRKLFDCTILGGKSVIRVVGRKKRTQYKLRRGGLVTHGNCARVGKSVRRAKSTIV